MRISGKSRPVRWAAELHHVREVSLLGAVDLSYWKDRLQSEGVVLAEREGRAVVMIVAAELTYFGLRFRELSVSLQLVSPVDDGLPNTWILVNALNTSRFIAYCERTFFSTPYVQGDVRVAHEVPAAIAVVEDGISVFSAAMDDFGAAMHVDASVPARRPAREGTEVWLGRIRLPRKSRAHGRPGRMFFARLGGSTRTYPFLTSQDRCEFQPRSRLQVFRDLQESHFTPQEWVVRGDAIHAKSMTYRQNEVIVVNMEVI